MFCRPEGEEKGWEDCYPPNHFLVIPITMCMALLIVGNFNSVMATFAATHTVAF